MNTRKSRVRAYCSTLLSGSAAFLMLIPSGCAQTLNDSTSSPNPATLNIGAEITGPIQLQSEPGAPYINNWLILGTFDNDAQNTGYERDWISEVAVEPTVGATIAGKTWHYFDDRLFSRNYDDYQDLFSYFRVKQNQPIDAKVVYAHSYIYSARAQTVQLRAGADTSFKAWLNGVPVVASTRSTPPKLIVEAERVHLNSGRDYVVGSANLQAGWNRLLLKVANREAGRFGFYARLTQLDGKAVIGLTYSTGGGKGELAIATASMPEAKTGLLPTAYSEWSYVGAKVDLEKLTKLGSQQSGPNGQLPPALPNMGIGFHYNKGLGVQASPFSLTAQGGSAPYRWSLVQGKLPAGLRLGTDGSLEGTPAAASPLGEYAFTVQVQDSTGKTARKAFVLPLKKRPNRWVEEKRLIGLIHGPERILKADVPKVAQQLKREGYGLGMPITYNNGDLLFRWPTAFGTKKTSEDWVALYKAALEKEGIGFAMYMGNTNVETAADFNANQQVLMVEEAIRRYRPKALWFDWLGLDGTSLDSLFSMIRSYDPELVIIVNGMGRASNGDWDILSYEGWQAWGKDSWKVWPAKFDWPKKHTPESWRLAVESRWPVATGQDTDWREMLQIQLSLIGEGFIADIDHSSDLIPSDGMTFEERPLVKLHNDIANWANPSNLPALTEAYTNVDTGPLNQGLWGYDTVNLKGDAIYLIAIKNPRGKTGLPSNGTMNLGPVGSKIKAVTLMNNGSKLTFSQNAAGKATINLKGVKPDPVATIIKVELYTPLTKAQLAKPKAMLSAAEASQKPIPEGNLACFKPSWLMSADGTRELGPSRLNYAIDGNDGNLSTGAQAAFEYAWSYKVDLKQTHEISRIVVHFDAKLWATEFNILTSVDGKDWKTIVSEKQGKPGEYVAKFASTSARFVRVQALKPDGADQPGAQMCINELQVFAK